jgi:hypothetical protein
MNYDRLVEALRQENIRREKSVRSLTAQNERLVVALREAHNKTQKLKTTLKRQSRVVKKKK